MSLASAFLLASAIATLAATGLLSALALRIDSPGETLLTAYVAAWAWLVSGVMALSLVDAVSTWGVWVVLAVGLAGAGGGYWRSGRRRLVHVDLRRRLRAASRDGPLATLAFAVAAGTVYSLVVGVGVAPNDGDGLAYHLPRALFWKQQASVSWIANATDPRLDVMPPGAEIGQLATMLVSGRDTYVSLAPFFALGAAALAVALLARRLGIDGGAAVFGAALFVSSPVVILQAASALNDLVVCSFLTSAAVLLISPRRASTLAGALATALAVATKVTALFGLPWIVLLVVVSNRRRCWRSLAALGTGLVLGSGWYWLNLWHTGRLDGGYGEESGQRPAGLGVVVTTMRQLALDVLDRSGVRGDDLAVYFVAAGVLGLVACAVAARGKRPWALVGGALLVAVVPAALAPLGSLLLRGWQKMWLLLGDASLAFQPPTQFRLPVEADATESWYGPVLGVCLVLTPIALLWRGRRRSHRALLAALSLAPVLSIGILAVLLTYDPFRGRFLMFEVALAAASWGAVRRWPAATWGLTGLATVSMAMSLAMSMGKPSGVVLFEADPGPVSRQSIWTRSRVEQQGQLRPGDDEIDVLRFVERTVPADASIALAARPNDYLSPFFGPQLRRRVILVSDESGESLASADWLVTAPGTGAGECPGDWHERFGVGDWKVLGRVGRDACAG